jgi:hypothetical protein
VLAALLVLTSAHVVRRGYDLYAVDRLMPGLLPDS